MDTAPCDLRRPCDTAPLPIAGRGWTPDPQDPASADFRIAVSAALDGFLRGRASQLDEMGPEVGGLLAVAQGLLAGGKRLRPAFCVWGYAAVAGVPSSPDNLANLVVAAASLDLLHVSALVHDDVMDGSDLRRGLPAAHRQLEAEHRRQGWRGDPAEFGRCGAILLGDLLLVWSGELLHRSGLDPLTLERGLPLLEAMRTEVTCGQYLDIVAAHRPAGTSAPAALAEASAVTEFKSARYTVQRPAQVGAAWAGGDQALLAGLAAYGSPLGRAFQYRDDLLGVFGDARVTGKPAGDDLREGKRTVLVAHAYARTDAAGRALLDTNLGNPDLDPAGVTKLQEVIAASGAAAAVEEMITERHAAALAALEAVELTAEGRTALVALAAAAVSRTA